MGKLYRNKEWLYQKYIVDKLSTVKIGKLSRVNSKTILYWLKKYNIPIRSLSETNKGHIPWNKGKIGVYSKETLEKMGRNSQVFRKGHIPWNKGLRRDNDIRVMKNVQKFLEGQKRFYENGGNPWNKNNKFPQVAGLNNHNWKGGITPLMIKIRSYRKYDEWRRKVYKRDNYTCQICGNNKGHNLNSHHIISFSKIIQYFEIIDFQAAIKCKLLWDINNGITLCEKCHDRIHSKEGKKWAYFNIRSRIYDKTGLLLPNENIINGMFTMGYWGNSEEDYMLRMNKGVIL